MTASFDVTHYCHVSAELTSLCVDTLPSIPKGYANRCNIAAVVSSWLSMLPPKRGRQMAPARGHGNAGASPLGWAAEIGT